MPDDDRPLLHFTARAGWINDPLGITWHDGLYHLFFQYVPGSTEWSVACRWGHAVSPDLVHWTELPIALEPGDGDDGVWSGGLAVDDSGAATIFYTSVVEPDLGAGRVRTARPLDDAWIRWAKGPVVVQRPKGVSPAMFRDPFVVRDGDGWRMLVGAALEGGSGAALGFASPDLDTWTYEGVVAERAPEVGDGVWTGAGWECPQLLRVDGADVLVFSTWEPDAIHHVAAAIGEFRDGRFTARHWQRIGWGAGYAGSAFHDRDGRPCLVLWIRGAGGGGWAGALTVPQVLRIADDRIVLEPHPSAVAAAATAGRPVVEVTVEPGATADLGGGLTLGRTDGDLVLAADGVALGRVPSASGAVRTLVDGGVVEVWTDAGALAAAR